MQLHAGSRSRSGAPFNWPIAPGGCADLLAACMFLDRAEPRSAARNFSASTRV
jgi:hypothetical protein